MSQHEDKGRNRRDPAPSAASAENKNNDGSKYNHRFPPGKSGNRKGRPKGSKNRQTIIREIAAEKHRIKTGIGTQNLTTIELALLELRNHVASGSSTALRCYETLQNKYGEKVSSEQFGVLVAPAEISQEDWINRQMKINESKKPPPGYDEV